MGRNSYRDLELYAEKIWKAEMASRKQVGLDPIDFESFYSRNKSWLIAEWAEEKKQNK